MMPLIAAAIPQATPPNRKPSGRRRGGWVSITDPWTSAPVSAPASAAQPPHSESVSPSGLRAIQAKSGTRRAKIERPPLALPIEGTELVSHREERCATCLGDVSRAPAELEVIEQLELRCGELRH